MQFILAIIGAVLGAVWASISDTLFALFVGGALGWFAGMVFDLRKRAESLERQIEQLATKAPLLARYEEPREQPSRETRAEPQAQRSPAVPRREPAPAAATSAARRSVPPDALGPAERPAPAEPDLFERGFRHARDWLLTGNVPVKVGVIISFFGVAFLLKYAVDEGLFRFPIEFRLAGIAAGAIAMLAIGWRVRTKNRVYALSIQGCGVGVLYLTVFAAFRLYELLPASVAFLLLLVLTASAAMLAVLQRAQTLALLGTAGGFLAPILASTDSGNHVALFSYYLVLNLAIVAIAWFMAWRLLNLVGFAFTFVIGAVWGARYYGVEHFASVEPFLIAYFVIYLAIAVLFALRHGAGKLAFVEGSLVFGLPVVAFAYQMELVEPYAYARAASALGAAIVYGALARWLLRRPEPAARLLCEAILALAVGFGTLAVPLALDAQWTAAAWALEGAGLLWVGLRQSRLLAQVAGVALQLVASAVLLARYGELASAPMLVNSRTLGGLMIALAMFASVAMLQRLAPRDSQSHDAASIAFAVLGSAWWYATGVLEIEASAPASFFLAIAITFCAVSAAAIHAIATRAAAPRLDIAAAALTPLLSIGALAWRLEHDHPAEAFGALAWPAAILVQFWLTDRLRVRQPRFANAACHVALWIGAALLAWEAHWALGALAPYSIWGWVGAIAALGAAGHLVFTRAPGTRFDTLAGAGAAVPLIAALLFALVLQLASRADPRPLPYLPIANPLDVATLAVGGVLALWYRARGASLVRSHDGERAAWIGLVALSFVVITMTTVRTFVHWANLPHDADAVVQSDGLQAALSIVWAALAVAAMFFGARSGKRMVWVAGAALMTLVVGKLLVVDLGNTGTIARIVSFIGVGLLLLAIGWFAPLPARTAEATR